MDTIAVPAEVRYRLASRLLRDRAFDRWYSAHRQLTDITFESFRIRMELEYCPLGVRQTCQHMFLAQGFDETVTILRRFRGFVRV